VNAWGTITDIGGEVGIFPHLRTVLLGAVMMAAATGAFAAQPVVDSFEATPASVQPGATVTLTVTAHDPDCPDSCTSGCGQYIRADLTQWDPGAGSFDSTDNGSSGSPYTASAVWRAPSAEGPVTVTVTLADSGTFMCGGRQTASAQVVIQVSVNAGQEPVITSLTIDPNPVRTGTEATVTATAEDPQGDPVSFSWSIDRGTITPGTEGTATYSAPATPGPVNLICTASDPGGASSSKTLTFSVTDVEPEVLLDGEMAAPHDVAANVFGDLLVVDDGLGGLAIVNGVTGEALTVVRLAGATSVVEDWLGRVVVGTRTGGILLLAQDGALTGTLVPPTLLGPVTDLAADAAGRKIWALYGTAARVVAYDAGGNQVAAFGERGGGPGELREPVAVAWSPVGEVLVADAALGQVLAFSPSGSWLRSMGGLGAAAGEFTRLGGVAATAAGVIYATDTFQSRFQSFNPDGSLREVVGVFGHALGELDTPAGITLLGSPPRLAVASVNGPNVQIFRLDDTQPATPQAAVSPASLDLGSVPVGERSDPAVVTLRNTGTVPVGIYGIDSPGLFQVQSTCGNGLDPGESCTATVVFEPERAGRVVGTLAFRCSGVGDQAVTLVARGTALEAAMAAISESSVDFGGLPVGRTSGVRTLVVTNTGGVQLNVNSVLLGGAAASQFVVQSDTCTGAALGAGETCVIGVAFAPTGEGRHSAILTVESNSAGGPLAVDLSGEGVEALPIPTVGPWGTGLLVLLLALAGLLGLGRRRAVIGLMMVSMLATAGVALAVDPPHWYFGMDCASCHTGHNAAGGNLTVSAGNVNLCQSCHNPSGLASALPINSSDRAVPGQAGTSHRFDMPVDASHQGAQMPTNPEMAARIMGGNVVCSTCHDQHAAKASNRGQLRVSVPERLTSLGSTGQVSVGGSYTGAGGSSYLIEITIADAHFRYSKDGGSTWAGEADIGTGVPLDNGLTVTFSGGSFALGERWRFTASYPFLRAALDQGDNTSGDRFCRDCHSLWTMDYNAVEVFDWTWKSHPVGVALNANGRGYDRTTPLDGNGAVQGSGGGAGVASSVLKLDSGGLVQCLTCHGVHYTDSNTLTEDGP